MEVLKLITVHPSITQMANLPPKTLADYVDEPLVQQIVQELKTNIGELLQYRYVVQIHDILESITNDASEITTLLSEVQVGSKQEVQQPIEIKYISFQKSMS